MDPLSITASIIAVLQATTAVLSVCYDYRSAIKHHPWGLAKAIDEVRDLRNVLESLEKIATKFDESSATDPRLSNLRLLCNQETGPLQGCLAELHQLEKKITSPKWSNQLGKKRKALIQAIGWQVKDVDVQQSLQHLNRFKMTLSLALSVDEAALLLDIQEVSSSVQSGVLNVQEDVSTLKRQYEIDRLDGRQKKLLQWLSPVDPEQSHKVAQQLHQEGTGEWIIHSQEISEWKSGHNHCLWLSGLPGAGKTVLFSTLVSWIHENLNKEKDEEVLAYFYCDFRKPESQEPINIIGSLVAQTCMHLGFFPQELEDAYAKSMNSSGQMTKPTMAVLEAALKTFSSQRKLLLLVDALDECTNSKAVTQVLNELINHQHFVKLLVTSRDELLIRRQLASASRLLIGSHTPQISVDIGSYIGRRFEIEPGFKWLKPSFKAEIQDSLRSKSGGM
jgi:hypothetical protein